MIGILSYMLGIQLYTLSNLISNICCYGGVLLFFIGIFKSKDHYISFQGIDKFLYIAFLINALCILLRIDSFQGAGLFRTPFQILSFLPPLVTLLGISNLPIRTIINWTLIYCIIGWIVLPFTYEQAISISLMDADYSMETLGIALLPRDFLIVSSFTLLCYAVIPSRYAIIALLAMITYLILVILTARRGAILMGGYMFATTAYIFSILDKRGNRMIKSTICILIIIGISIYVLTNLDTTFMQLNSRGISNSREDVEVSFFKYFATTIWDWVFGKGINGRYYDPIFHEMRSGIETGYLNMILKGGIIYLMLFITILLRAAYLGFYHSRNLLTKGMAFYIVYFVIWLYPFGLPAFNVLYINLWICILYCNNNQIRKLNNNQIRKLINSKQ